MKKQKTVKAKIFNENITTDFVYICFSFYYQLFDESSFRTCDNINNCLRDLSYDKSLGVGVPRQYVVHSKTFLTNNIYCFDYHEHIESRQASILIRRDFNLLTFINKHILMLSEHGLIEKWSNDYQMNRIKKNVKNSNYKYLLVGHLVSLVYFILFPGYCFAFTAFAIEIVAGLKRNRNSNYYNVWIFLDIIVSGKYFCCFNNNKK